MYISPVGKAGYKLIFYHFSEMDTTSEIFNLLFSLTEVASSFAACLLQENSNTMIAVTNEVVIFFFIIEVFGYENELKQKLPPPNKVIHITLCITYTDSRFNAPRL